MTIPANDDCVQLPNFLVKDNCWYFLTIVGIS